MARSIEQNYQDAMTWRIEKEKDSRIPCYIREAQEETRRLVVMHSSGHGNLLDVGCGGGYLLSLFAGSDFVLHGCDIAPCALTHEGVTLKPADIDDRLPYESDFFDVVVCTAVLEHVMDLNHACSELLRVLKPNGVLVVSVPDREDMTRYVKPDIRSTVLFARSSVFMAKSLSALFEGDGLSSC